ncbi:adenylyl-sulfate kinase [Kribbella qitaiheensis]|uniref:Adenylyl-sulfate kinase n=2 Tax=Kribbella qitaiheensis TaxID=1544730 RepID=A0A7G6XAM5_9ACTN|nr:adenylyl-sulfate kinase [Kribbella qitaiheensis]
MLAEAIAAGLEGTHLWRPRSAAETIVDGELARSGARGAEHAGAERSGAERSGAEHGGARGAEHGGARGAEHGGARGAEHAGAERAGSVGGDLVWVEGLGRLRGATKEMAGSGDVLLAKVMPVLSRWRPPRRERGVVVFFTGLSGSGKSTLAKGLAEYLTGHVDRTVTLLDGDIVRRMLSSGLGFDRAGRDLNVRRIGFVAAEVARHGGIAVCAPIAPYADSRAAVRAMVEAVGDLVLVHVATPLEECERRDVKGLYKKARAGVVTQFTGISDPYDEPLDADLRVDTTGVSFEESLAVITEFLAAGGWLPTRTTPTDPQPGG